MPRESFQEDLDDLQDDVLALGETVAARLRRAVAAIENHDPDLAAYVRDGDAEVNEQYLAIESDCIDLLTLQQPVAGDLRFVAASFKIITDLERIGDLATNLGGYVLEMNREGPPRDRLAAIGHRVAEQLDDALTAYARQDPDLCREVAERDDAIDDLCAEAADGLVRGLVEQRHHQTPVDATLSSAQRVLLTVRDLERVGDHAVNVAARTLYMVESSDELLY
ncbi:MULTISPECIES: phosphate signaling complex protein PhoU [Salinibaculum]|uniref:phosphate signaling complex protein PhoU n=1 Tax=Salinibaculum TaxID=2732368 RepID=UPI0030CAC725